MARKTAYLQIRVTVESEDPNIDLDEVISDLDYDITSMTEGAKIVSTEITDREIKDGNN